MDESKTFKKESEQLLEVAKQSVEMAIEEGEEKAMTSLKVAIPDCRFIN